MAKKKKKKKIKKKSFVYKKTKSKKKRLEYPQTLQAEGPAIATTGQHQKEERPKEKLIVEATVTDDRVYSYVKTDLKKTLLIILIIVSALLILWGIFVYTPIGSKIYNLIQF